jgi:hypothetical protein
MIFIFNEIPLFVLRHAGGPRLIGEGKMRRKERRGGIRDESVILTT